MSKQQYIIADQLKFWMQKKDKKVLDLRKFFPHIRSSKQINRWFEGCKTQAKTVRRIAEFFEISPEEFFGEKVEEDDDESCGIQRVLEILNSSGRDYLGNDSETIRELFAGETDEVQYKLNTKKRG